MPEYSQEDLARASQLMHDLLSGERKFRAIPEDLVIFDVEKETTDFLKDLRVLEQLGLPMPAAYLQGSYPIPVALDMFDPNLAVRWPEPTSDYSFDALSYFRQHPKLVDALKFFPQHPDIHGYGTMDRDQARSVFEYGASSFLATRMAGVRELREEGAERSAPRMATAGGGFDYEEEEKPPPVTLKVNQRVGGDKVNTPGCEFEVSTDSCGLRVFWSGAFRESPNYFNHPTSPASSVLQSGTYMFGVDGGDYGSDIQWDRNAIVALPGLPSVHLNF